jgi:hypothetical protein
MLIKIVAQNAAIPERNPAEHAARFFFLATLK